MDRSLDLKVRAAPGLVDVEDHVRNGYRPPVYG